MIRRMPRLVLVGLLVGVASHCRADLVAHWPLDDSGIDIVGGHDGLESGGVTYGVPGANANTGLATSFLDGMIDVPFSQDLNPTDFTVAFWARLTGGAEHRSPITSRYDGIVFGGGNLDGYIVYCSPGTVWEFWTGDGESAADGWDVLGGPPIELEVWQHIAITYESATQTKTLYVNGTVAATGTDQSYAPVTNEERSLHIGGGGDMGIQYRWVGDVDDVGIWDEVLSEEAIMAIIDNGIMKPAVANLTAAPLRGSAPLEVSFDATGSSTPEGTITDYTWNFGDGETATGLQIKHTYQTAGIYKARLTVKDTRGATGSASVEVFVMCPTGDVAPWQSKDVGTPVFPGAARLAADCLEICGGGKEISARADHFHFVYQVANGDGVLTTRLQDAALEAGARTGLMFRDSLDTDSPFVLMGFVPATGGVKTIFANRKTAGGSATTKSSQAPTLIPPDAWLRLERKGAEFIGSSSPDGQTWTEYGRVTLGAPAASMLAGVAVNGADKLEKGIHAGVTFCSTKLEPSGPLPVSFRRGDVDQNNERDLTDVVQILGYLFLGQETSVPPCLDAADADDDGKLELTDPVVILGFLFLGSGVIAPPTECGPDPTSTDPLECTSHASC